MTYNILTRIYNLEALLISWYQNCIPYRYIYPIIKLSKLLTKRYTYYLYFIIIAINNWYLVIFGYIVFLLIRYFNIVIKHCVCQQRPYNKYPTLIRYFRRQKNSYSFPSQSTQSITYIYHIMYDLYPSIYTTIYFMGIILLLLLTRTYRGLHYPHDIIVSYLFTISICNWIDVYFNKNTIVKIF